MQRSSSNAVSLKLIHGVWTLVAAAAFGLGYLASSPAPTSSVPGETKRPAPAASGIADQNRANPEELNRDDPRPAISLPPPENSASLEAPVSPSLPPPPLEDDPVADGMPQPGGPLLPEQAHRLLAERVLFNPGSIPSSNVPVGPDTPLAVGQELQVKWGNTWWAGTILGFEPDGRVRIHYFGWAASYDEPKPRVELQLDRGARVRALDQTYVRKGW